MSYRHSKVCLSMVSLAIIYLSMLLLSMLLLSSYLSAALVIEHRSCSILSEVCLGDPLNHLDRISATAHATATPKCRVLGSGAL